MLDSPVLFIIFNRPQTTEKVFHQIKKARPKKFYIAADGPRPDHSDDVDKCEAARQIALNIDWGCRVKTRFRETNMGCGLAVSDAINWFFTNEESGIILEDDCLPSQSFFYFCQELLKKYKYNDQIMHINGNNFNAPINKLVKSHNSSNYYLGSFAQAWGWASWSRAWKKFDYNIESWPRYKRSRRFIKKFPNLGSYLEKSLHFDTVHRGKDDIWDYQWQYAVLVNDGLVIVPAANLVSNIGYGSDATHIKTFDTARNNLMTEDIEYPLKHPPQLSPIKNLDYHYAFHMGMRPRLKNFTRYFFSYFK